MTICIAALCENNGAVVIASDRMITAGFLALEFEHPDSKIEILNNTCVGLSAGDALASVELFRESKAILQQLQSPPVEKIAEQVGKLFVDLRRGKAEDNILRPRGLTLKDFYEAGLINRLPPDLAMVLDRGIQQAVYPIEIIIAGLDYTGAHIYGVQDPGIVDCYDKLGYHAIGSGLSHALLTVISNDHSPNNNLNNTVYLVYEAKKKAELAQGVGEATELGVVTASGIRMLSTDDKQALQEIFDEKMAPQLENIQRRIDDLPYKSLTEKEK